MANSITIAQRHKYILDRLKRDGYASVSDIAAELGITTVTVRKDFRTLEGMGLLYRSHGSASPVNPHVADRNVTLKERENSELKKMIGREAAKLVAGSDSVMIASGSTIYSFIGEINPVAPLNVVTPSLRVALTLTDNENITVIQLGGIVHKKSMSIKGGTELSQFDRFTCSTLFIGVDGINEEYGVTTSNLEEAALTRNMMGACSRTVVLADSSKFTKRGFGKISGLDQIHTLVTDPGITRAQKEKFEEYGIEVIIAE